MTYRHRLDSFDDVEYDVNERGPFSKGDLCIVIDVGWTDFRRHINYATYAYPINYHEQMKLRDEVFDYLNQRGWASYEAANITSSIVAAKRADSWYFVEGAHESVIERIRELENAENNFITMDA